MTKRLRGIHSDHPELGLMEHGFVSVGWDDLGDLTRREPGREAFKAMLREARPETKEGAIRVVGVCSTGSSTR